MIEAVVREFPLQSLVMVFVAFFGFCFIAFATCYDYTHFRFVVVPDWLLLLGKPWVVLADHNSRKAIVTFRTFIRQILKRYAYASRRDIQLGIPYLAEVFDEKDILVFSQDGNGVTGILDELEELLHGCVVIPARFFVPKTSSVDLVGAYRRIHRGRRKSPR